MTSQRFELSATIGGFSPEDAAAMEITVHENRNNLAMPKPLMKQAMLVRRAFGSFLDSVHSAVARQKFGREILLEEALANVVFHGNHADATLQSMARLTIEKKQTETGEQVSCVLMLDDHLPRFDLEELPDRTRPENLDNPNGRGLLLIREVGKATISQVPREGGKTMIFSWNEDTAPPETSVPTGE